MIFVEAIDKLFHDSFKTGRSIDEQALEQIVSRFQKYLEKQDGSVSVPRGIIVHDNNQTVAKKHTALMKDFYTSGTLWTKVTRVVETPLFVDSSLTRMIQVADLVSYAFRRYLENDETGLFEILFPRVHHIGKVAVGARHYTGQPCSCAVCKAHKMPGMSYGHFRRRHNRKTRTS